MKSTHNTQRGQVLIIFVFAIIALIGMVALAIDGGNVYSDRRHAQNGADTAAMAAALFRNSWQKNTSGHPTCDGFTTDSAIAAAQPSRYPQPSCRFSIINRALDLALQNGYDSNNVDNRVDVYSPPKDGPYSDCSAAAMDNFDCHDYIQVVIKDDVNTWFARVLGIGQMHNQVQAVALANYAPSTQYYGGMTLVELNTGNGNCPSDFDISGGGTVTLNGGGIWVNSSNLNCALKQTSCNTQILGDAVIQVVGGANMNGCTGNANTVTVQTNVSPAYDYVPAHIFPAPPDKPPYCKTHVGTWLNGNFNPGDYSGKGAFPIGNANATLQPGVYCVDQLVTTKNITGHGVFIYIYPTSNKSQVDMSGGVIDLTAISDANSPYAGFLIYGDYDQNSWTNNPPTCTIAGGTNSVYTGMIWVPLCDLSIEGNTSSSGENAQIIAASIKLGGTMNLTFTYDDSKYPHNPEVNKTGLYR